MLNKKFLKNKLYFLYFSFFKVVSIYLEAWLYQLHEVVIWNTFLFTGKLCQNAFDTLNE